MRRDQISMMILLLLMPLAALAFVSSDFGGTCANGNTVGEPNGVGIVGCSSCINDGGVYDRGLADCRQCCNQLAGPIDSDAFRDCRRSNGC